jgi:hypothetical protein
MVASGASPSDVASELGLPDYQVTLLLSRTAVIRKTKQIKEEYWGANMAKQFDLAAPAALALARQLVDGDLSGAKTSERWSAAQWILEKSTGKPKQEVALSGDHTLRQLFAELELLRQTAEGGPDARLLTETKDVTPAKSEMERWVEENIPGD